MNQKSPYGEFLESMTEHWDVFSDIIRFGHDEIKSCIRAVVTTMTALLFVVLGSNWIKVSTTQPSQFDVFAALTHYDIGDVYVMVALAAPLVYLSLKLYRGVFSIVHSFVSWQEGMFPLLNYIVTGTAAAILMLVLTSVIQVLNTFGPMVLMNNAIFMFLVPGAGVLGLSIAFRMAKAVLK